MMLSRDSRGWCQPDAVVRAQRRALGASPLAARTWIIRWMEACGLRRAPVHSGDAEGGGLMFGCDIKDVCDGWVGTFVLNLLGVDETKPPDVGVCDRK